MSCNQNCSFHAILHKVPSLHSARSVSLVAPALLVSEVRTVRADDLG